MSSSPPPTPTELAILGVLWESGPSTVRTVHDHLSKRETLGYTSVLKMLQVMHKKGLVKRDESQRSHIYRAARPAAQVQRRLVSDLINRAFAGSAAELAVRALSARPVPKEELARVRAFLDQIDDGDG
ncbi:MAG: BlaI/MecI/CopY family transcriptional regulator [Myxococcota bacterium]